MTYFAALRFVGASSWAGGLPQAEGSYSLHFCRAGRVKWSMDGGRERLLNAPLVWWTVPAHSYSFGVGGGASEWEHLEVRFAGEQADEMLREGLLIDTPDTLPVKLLPNAEAFEHSFAALIAILKSDDVMPKSNSLAHARAVLYLEELLLMLQEGGTADVTLSPLEEAVNEWLEEVRRAPQLNWNLAEDAAKLAISEGHFRRVVGKLAGVSPHRFVLDRRLDAGAMRLRTTKEPIKAVAPACGFEDVNHFTRLFTARFHLPPAAYRRTNRLMAQEAARLKRRQSWSLQK